MNRNTNLKAIIFDFDGTLAKLNIDFLQMRKNLTDLIASYGVPVRELSHLLALEMIEAGGKWLETNDGTRRADYAEKTGRLIYDIEMDGARNGELLPGVREMLSELKLRGIASGVLTRNCREAVMVMFPDISEYCGAVVTRESTVKFKPDPEHLRIALDAVKVPPSKSAMVGDHPIDIEVGKRLGTMTIGVLTGYYNRQGLEEAGADMIIDSAVLILDYI